MELTWLRNPLKERWYELTDEGLEKISASGVYIIWWGEAVDPDSVFANVVYVGSGNIGQRLAAHRGDPRIMSQNEGRMYVTFAYVHKDYRGIEQYLADELKPVVGDRHPHEIPIEVNMPRLKGRTKIAWHFDKKDDASDSQPS